MDPLPPPFCQSCQAARQFPEEESASQFQVEQLWVLSIIFFLHIGNRSYFELWALSFSWVWLQTELSPLAGYITQLHFQFVPHISWCPYSVMGWGAPGGGRSLWFRVHASDITAAFDLPHCLRNPPSPLPSSISTPPLLPPPPPQAEISGVREARVVPYHPTTLQYHIQVLDIGWGWRDGVVGHFICPAQQPVLYVCHPGIVDTASAP